MAVAQAVLTANLIRNRGRYGGCASGDRLLIYVIMNEARERDQASWRTFMTKKREKKLVKGRQREDAWTAFSYTS